MKISRNLLVEQTWRALHRPLPLSLGECGATLAHVGGISFLGAPQTILFESFVDGVEEILIAEWLGQGTDRPIFHGFHAHGDIAMTGNHNRWKLKAQLRHTFQKLHTATSRHPYVENQASRHVVELRSERFLYRCDRS